jgi:hypothetical protein
MELIIWTTLNAIIQEEPVEERDRFFMAWLNNLGNKEKAQPFKPNSKDKKKFLIAAAVKRQFNGNCPIHLINDLTVSIIGRDRKWHYVDDHLGILRNDHRAMMNSSNAPYFL